MNSDINLIVSSDDKKEAEKRRVKKLQTSSLVLLIGVGMLSVILFFLKSQLPIASYKKEESVALNNLAVLQVKQSKMLLINERMQSIQDIVQKRPDLSQKIQTFFSFIPSNISIDSFTLQNKTIQVSISSTSLLSLNTFLDTLTSRAGQKDFFSSVTLDSLSTTDSGRYTVGIEAEIL